MKSRDIPFSLFTEGVSTMKKARLVWVTVTVLALADGDSQAP